MPAFFGFNSGKNSLQELTLSAEKREVDSEWEELTLWRDTKQLNVLGTLKVRVKRKKDWKGERRLIRVDD